MGLVVPFCRNVTTLENPLATHPIAADLPRSASAYIRTDAQRGARLRKKADEGCPAAAGECAADRWSVETRARPRCRVLARVAAAAHARLPARARGTEERRRELRWLGRQGAPADGPHCRA